MVWTVTGTVLATLRIQTQGAGSIKRVEWSPCGERLACWCSDPPAVHLFTRQGWTCLAVIPFDGFAQSTRGLVHGIQHIVHVSWAGSLEEEESLSFCKLPLPGTQHPGATPEHINFKLVHSTSEVPEGEPDTLPALSPDGAFLALVDRSFMLHVVQCSTRVVVLQKAVRLPPVDVPADERTDVVKQLYWLRNGRALLVVLAVEDIDPPLAVNLVLFNFDES